jgi:segregation and condensation protein B
MNMTKETTSLDNANIDLEAAIEAMIFISKDPLTIDEMVSILAAKDLKVSHAILKKVLHGLISTWECNDRSIGRGLALKNISNGYIFTTALCQADIVKTMVATKPIELTKAQVEVLSIVAYRQPITRVDIDEIRGVDSSFAIKRLLDIKLLKILGKSEGLGRPLLYGTSKKFLEFFGLNSLNDLPTLKQYESLNEIAEIKDLNDKNVSFKDLFNSTTSSMFSSDVEKQSEDALRSLDDAMLRVDGTSKL